MEQVEEEIEEDQELVGVLWVVFFFFLILHVSQHSMYFTLTYCSSLMHSISNHVSIKGGTSLFVYG